MKSVRKLPGSEFRAVVCHVAKLFCWRRFTLDHPGATVPEQNAHVERCWQAWIDTALDFLATREALAEKDAASRN